MEAETAFHRGLTQNNHNTWKWQFKYPEATMEGNFKSKYDQRSGSRRQRNIKIADNSTIRNEGDRTLPYLTLN